MTKLEAFNEINDLQDEYVSNLLKLINSSEYKMMKTIDFTSPTGTGKTKMMSKLINLLPEYYFIVTTLSKGQLHLQVRARLEEDCLQQNFYVYGSSDYRINSKLDAESIIGMIPDNTNCIWLRDEGHIKTNRFDEILRDVCDKVINFSATNPHSDIQCNFTQTMMLRTVNQASGTLEDAIRKLIEIKEIHKPIKNYNPCAIFRCVNGGDSLRNEIISLCKKNKLKYIDINDDPYVMSELCEDDNKYDVIINKFKLVEGIDIRRAHVLYMDNQPDNNATTIQAIGRCRRNALLYRDDIDILASENEKLLKKTRECYVYYNVKNMRIDTDQDGELQYAFCNHISCEELKPGTTIEVIDGQLTNGLFVLELKGKSGRFAITIDEETGFNIVNPVTEFYAKVEEDYVNSENYIYLANYLHDGKIHIKYLRLFPMTLGKELVDDPAVYWPEKNHPPFYDLYKTFYCHSEFRSCCIATCGKYCDSFKLKPYNDMYSSFESIEKFKALFFDFARKYTCKYITDCLVAKTKKYGVSKDSIDDSNFINLATIKLFIDYAYVFFIRKNCRVWSTDKTMSLVYSGCEKYLKTQFRNFETLLDLLYVPKDRAKEYGEIIYSSINNLIECVNNHMLKDVYYDYDNLFIPLTETEKYRIQTKQLPEYYGGGYYKKQLLTSKTVDELVIQTDYSRIVNDKHSAVIGTDSMKQIRLESGSCWVEAKAITYKIGSYTKLDRYISKQYYAELDCAREQYFSGKNTFLFDKKCNSIIGYCVEYYSKFLLYGKKYLYPYLDNALKEAHRNYPSREIVVRACMLKYKAMMALCFGKEAAKLIQGISAEQLLTDKYKEFISVVVKLGKRTAEYVKATIYPNVTPTNDVDPNLSVLHISGLADYITHDTILDVKVRNSVDEKCIRQVLAYHYLSTKRSDLCIKRVIVYDASSDRAVIVPIESYNQNNIFQEINSPA